MSGPFVPFDCPRCGAHDGSAEMPASAVFASPVEPCLVCVLCGQAFRVDLWPMYRADGRWEQGDVERLDESTEVPR